MRAGSTSGGSIAVRSVTIHCRRTFSGVGSVIFRLAIGVGITGYEMEYFGRVSLKR
jgi:hypothetical protein